MQRHTLNAIFLIAVTAMSTGAWAQNVYKCGDAYSQLPCPDGIKIDAADQRTNAQKTQSELVTRLDIRTAEAMEKARLQQEKKDFAATTTLVKPEITGAETNLHTNQAKKKKKKEPEFFTAQVPGKKKTKKAPKKIAAKKDENKV